jgi:drug/metabolite transporter (DMT)-like permease
LLLITPESPKRYRRGALLKGFLQINMSAAWFSIALGSTLLSALVNTLDSHFLSRRMPGMRSYLLIIGVFTTLAAVVMLLIFPFPRATPVHIYVLALISALLRVGAISALMYALKKEDVSRVMPLSATAPIFAAIMAALFLGEGLRVTQWLAIGIVVAGAVLISFKRTPGGASRFHASSFFLLIGSSVLYAGSDVLNKYTMNFISYWNSGSLSLLLTSLAFIVICLRRDVLREIRAMRRPWQAAAGVTANQVAAMSSTILAFWAIQNGPVALASTIFNSKPLFVFVFALALSRFAPGFLLKSPSDRREVSIKILATLLIVGGITLIFIV